MKITVLRILKLKLRDRSGAAMRGHTNQMMPAENLMQDNSVRKTSEPKAENEARPDQWMRPCFNGSLGILIRCFHARQLRSALAGVPDFPALAVMRADLRIELGPAGLE